MKCLLFFPLIFVIATSCTSKQNDKVSAAALTMEEQNKNLVTHIFADMVVRKNYFLVDSFYASNIFDHGAFEGQEQGIAGFKKAVTDLFNLFSKVNVEVEEILAERDLVSTREKWKLTRASDQKELSGEIMHWFRIKEGKVSEEWSKGWEWLGL